jgi:hypothetical protein
LLHPCRAAVAGRRGRLFVDNGGQERVPFKDKADVIKWADVASASDPERPSAFLGEWGAQTGRAPDSFSNKTPMR